MIYLTGFGWLCLTILAFTLSLILLGRLIYLSKKQKTLTGWDLGLAILLLLPLVVEFFWWKFGGLWLASSLLLTDLLAFCFLFRLLYLYFAKKPPFWGDCLLGGLFSLVGLWWVVKIYCLWLAFGNF